MVGLLTASETQSVIIVAGSMAGMHVADMVLETYLRVPLPERADPRAAGRESGVGF